MRIVPYLNENIIREHPKIFMGYSDVTSIHLKFYKAGVMSYYGPALLTDFAENVEMDEYTIKNIKRYYLLIIRSEIFLLQIIIENLD